MPPFIAAIIPAGGAGRRMGLSFPKQFCELAGTPVLVHTLKAFQQVDIISEVVLVVPAEHCARCEQLLSRYALDKVKKVLPGGRLRQDSVRIGLEALSRQTDCIVVHDGVRPLVSPLLIKSCVDEALQSGAAMAAVPVTDTVKAVSPENRIIKTVDRQGLWLAQTPQVANRKLLQEAFLSAEKDGFEGTDEASLLERIGCRVAIVAGSEKNIKVTRPEDLVIAEALLMTEQKGDNAKNIPPQNAFKVGHGYDAHRLVPDRPLVLGGVTIPHEMGLLGHSDADVLTHALCDALLGAVGAGDIGRHFPDSDPQYKNVSSLKLLEQVIELVREQDYALVNADITVVAQQPKLATFFAGMQENLAGICRVTPDLINIKGTTTEKMGFAGREEGIAAHAAVLIMRRP